MTGNIGKDLLAQARAAESEIRGATIKVDAETLRILERWPLGRTLKERAGRLIAAGDEYLSVLLRQEKGQ